MHMAIDRFIIKDKRIVYSFILKILRGFVTFAELKLVSKVEKEKKRMRFQKLGWRNDENIIFEFDWLALNGDLP